jgi:hypothetical protein
VAPQVGAEVGESDGGPGPEDQFARDVHKKCKSCWPTGELGEPAACTDQSKVYPGAAPPIMWEACHRRPGWPDGLPPYLVRCHHMWRAHAAEVRKAIGWERRVSSLNPFAD